MDARERDASTQKARTLSTKSFKNSSPGPRNAYSTFQMSALQLSASGCTISIRR